MVHVGPTRKHTETQNSKPRYPASSLYEEFWKQAAWSLTVTAVVSKPAQNRLDLKAAAATPPRTSSLRPRVRSVPLWCQPTLTQTTTTTTTTTAPSPHVRGQLEATGTACKTSSNFFVSSPSGTTCCSTASLQASMQTSLY